MIFKYLNFSHPTVLAYGLPKTNFEPIPNALKIKYYSSQQLSIWLSTFCKDWWLEEWPQTY